MATTPEHDARVAALTFAGIYPHYVTKIQKKGRSLEELHEALIGLPALMRQTHRNDRAQAASYKEFFEEASVYPNALITGSICGYKSKRLKRN